jgi:hypothetical protein
MVGLAVRWARCVLPPESDGEGREEQNGDAAEPGRDCGTGYRDFDSENQPDDVQENDEVYDHEGE